MKRGNFDFLKSYTYFVPGPSKVLVLMLWFLVGVFLGNIVTGIITAVAGASFAMEYGMLVAYPLMFVPAMMYASFTSKRLSMDNEGVIVDNDTHSSPLGWVELMAILLAGTLALGIAVDALNALLPQMPQWLKQTMESLTTGKFWINFISVSVFAPLFEEWLCRGMILRGLLARRMSPVWAIIISAAVFALIHMNPWQAVPAFLLGCFFGFVYYRTGSLKLTMWMHFVNNTFALVCGHIDSLKDYDGWMEMLGSAYWIVFAASLIIAALVVLRLLRIPLNEKSGNLDKVPSLFDIQ